VSYQAISAALAWLLLLSGCPGDAVAPDAGATDGFWGEGLIFGDSRADNRLGEGGPVDANPVDAATPAYEFDLDGDGNNDTDLKLAVCATTPTSFCLHLTASSLLSKREIVIEAAGAKGPTATRPVAAIGPHAGGALHEVAAVYTTSAGTPALAVLDVEGKKVLARASAPVGQTASFTDHARGPGGRRYPFLAPSYGDTPGAALWGYLCLYAPGASGSGTCGPHFRKVSTAPPDGAVVSKGYFFREVGGYLQDLDADGWDEIHLIYHATVLAISAKTGAHVSSIQYDVAAASEPASPTLFHSGRNYGTHAAFTAADGSLKTLVVGGIPVGSFADVNCNVSRFVAVLSSVKGQPATRKLAWSRYLGFASTIFSAYDPKYAANPPVARAADILDKCVHRFGDSYSVMDGSEVAIYNYFASDPPVDRCLDKQYQLYLPPTWTAAKAKAWYDCLAKNLKVTGVWGMQVLRLSDGLPLTGGQQNYVWGRTTTLLPGGEPIYLVEMTAKKTKYDLSQEPASKLQALALVKGLWTARGTFPQLGRPKLVSRPAEGPRGVGSSTAFAELTLQDLDADGLSEVQLADGSWVGYDAASKALVLKTP
jgi:hypothetical protein